MLSSSSSVSLVKVIISSGYKKTDAVLRKLVNNKPNKKTFEKECQLMEIHIYFVHIQVSIPEVWVVRYQVPSKFDDYVKLLSKLTGIFGKLMLGDSTFV